VGNAPHPQVTNSTDTQLKGLARRVRSTVAARLAPLATARAPALRRIRSVAAVVVNEGFGAAIQRVRFRLNPPVAPPPPEDIRYRDWLRHHEPTAGQLREMRDDNQRWAYRPLVSVVVPVYNPEMAWLVAMMESVRSQAYANWELCLADDLSPSPHVRELLTEWADADARVKIALRRQNGNIAAASNTALALAEGEFVAFLDHDDVLRPHALHRVVEALQGDGDIDLVFSDEDKILVGGERGQVHFKGEFDPDYLLSTNYVSHLSVLRRELVTAVGGFRSGVDGSQDHDLVLRVSEVSRRIRHVADVLYSWRQVPGSAALEHSEKPAAWEAGRRAVDDALRRRHPGARADLGPSPGLYVARYPIPSGVRITAIVMASEAATTARALSAYRRSSGLRPARWIVCGYDAGLEGLRDPTTDIVMARGSAHDASLLNDLVADDDSDLLVMLGGDLVPTQRNAAWLEPMVEQAVRTSVGAVGGRVVGVDGSAETDGLRVDGLRGVENGGLRLPVIQRVSAVSIECMAMRRVAFDAVGGFDRRYRTSMHDIDLCLRLRRAGLATVYTPVAEVQRLRPHLVARAKDDIEEFRAAWEGTPEWVDPFVSPWLETIAPFVIRDHSPG
jgi:O-antigen biosynthesis protein